MMEQHLQVELCVMKDLGRAGGRQQVSQPGMLERLKLVEIDHEVLLGDRELKQSHISLYRIERSGLCVDSNYLMPGDGSQSLFQGWPGPYDGEKRPAHIFFTSTVDHNFCMLIQCKGPPVLDWSLA